MQALRGIRNNQVVARLGESRRQVRTYAQLHVFVWLVRVHMDDGGTGIQALNDLCGMFRRGPRGKRVLVFEGNPLDRSVFSPDP